MPEKDTIIVIDCEQVFREDIKVVFSEIAGVEAFDGSKGASDFIKKNSERTLLIIIDVFLGDTSCMTVLDEIEGDDSASKIPIIVFYTSREDEDVIKDMLSQYKQVKFIIHKEDLMKKLIELSMKLPKKGKNGEQ